MVYDVVLFEVPEHVGFQFTFLQSVILDPFNEVGTLWKIWVRKSLMM